MCIFDEGGMVGLVHEEGQSMRKGQPMLQALYLPRWTEDRPDLFCACPF